MWHIYTMEFYSTVKKNEIMLFVGKWMELGIIMLRERSQAQKDKHHMLSLICIRMIAWWVEGTSGW
jgi:hypothetical protein